MPETTQRVFLGRGIFSWPRDERVSDRYGLVRLLSATETETVEYSGELGDWLGQYGRLLAVVVGTPRQSRHIGDLFRGIFPQMPERNEEIVLGEGALFTETEDGDQAIGLRPDEMRDADWLDPQKLYRAHDQDVELWFLPRPMTGAENVVRKGGCDGETPD